MGIGDKLRKLKLAWKEAVILGSGYSWGVGERGGGDWSLFGITALVAFRLPQPLPLYSKEQILREAAKP